MVRSIFGAVSGAVSSLDHMICPGKNPLTGQVKENESVSAVNKKTYACPYCELQNLTSSELIAHCNASHVSSKDKVV